MAASAIRDIQEERVRGRPYERPASIPVLGIPEGILAYGTADPLTDVTAQMHLFSLSGGPNISGA